ncbi:Ig-like domain-containing protein [Flavobacterium laiguense]|uniref:Uncharacterized protein n=1 Tax=Flavobacterium laiguense TaxID=2169409 RepID=A0A2U1JWF5_9FLAO|nr:Ig-like domain-containing protein [Flavobacterium laiguense]PWA09536.1 hypothetical protein DB891_07590 [Flavobacterium laiguense]
MKLKTYFLLAFLTIAPLKFFAQNTLSMQAVEVGTNTDFDLNVALQNQDNIAALQFDINYNATAFALLSGHELTSAAPNHSLSVSTPSPGIVRVIIYSTSNAVLNPGSGLLVRLKMKSKTVADTFNCGFNNVVGSSAASAAIAISGINQNVMVKGPTLSLLTTGVNFGRVPIGSNPTQQITVQNTGNLPLILNGNTAIAPFTIVGSYPVSISPNETKNIAIGLNTAAKINTTLNLGFQNNDPDPIRNIQTIALSATVYAVNEIHIGNGGGTINTEIEIPVYVNNMEAFNGFQFDVLLPADISYVNNSILQSLRFNGHAISVSVVNGNTLRFIAYSSSNKNFNGSSGELFRFKLKPAVSSGTYNLNISSPILSNATLGNIESDSYNGFIQINSPNLSIDNTTISYGNVPITESRISNVTLYNTGSSLLIIDSIVTSSGQIMIDASLPIEILPGASKMAKLIYKPTNIGSFSETVSFRYNGPDLQKIVNVQSTVFSPNFVMVKDQTGIKNQLNNFSILLKNTDAVRAIQFDVELPSGFNLQSSNLTTTARSAGFNVSASLLSTNKYRILLYSFSNASLSAGTESIINFPVSLNSNLNSGNYSFVYSNVILSNTANQNISSIALEDGKITFNDAPIAVADQITVDEGGAATTLVGGAATVLSNDTDAENNTLTAVLVSDVSNGTLTLNSNGTFSYVHNGSETVSDGFTYKANDGTSNGNVVTVMISVTPVNDAPIAVADQITVAEGGTATTLAGGATSVLTNDTDAENNTLTAVLVSGVSNGTLTLNSNGTFSYAHNGSETNSNSFTYKVNDGTSNSNIVTVMLTVTLVNDAPIAVADQITVTEGGTATTLVGGAASVLTNDTDAESNTLTAVLVSDVSNGTLTLNINGTFSYVHNGSETTSDSFTYKANDGNADSNVITVTITVTPVNDAPTAVADQITVTEGGTATTLVGGSTNVLANDIDAENNILTAVLVSGVSNGTLTLNSNGTFSYIHSGSATTSDGFSYKVNDGTSNGNVVTVVITITKLLSTNYVMIKNQMGIKNQLNNFSILLKNTDAVRAIQFDVELPSGFNLQSTNLTTTARSAGFSVSASLLSTNKYRILLYSFSNASISTGAESIINFPVSLNSNLSAGNYSFVYSNVILSNTANQNISSVAVEDGKITINDAPIAVADQITVAEGGTATTLVGGATNVLSNDTDLENNILTAILVSDVSNGTLTLNSNGTFSYTHNGSETTSDSFTYKANDGNADSNVITVTITVSPMNDAPTAVADQITVTEGGAATTLVGGSTNVLANDIDAENNILTAVLVSGVSNGTLTLNSNGTFSYIHSGSATTSDGFSYKVNDGTSNGNVVTVVITITKLLSTNYVMIKNQMGIKNQLNNFSILLKNTDAVRAIQFDVELPSGFNLQSTNLTTTARSAGFSVSASLLSTNKYRILLYSFSNASISTGAESIINFPVSLNSNLSAGNYSFVYSNVILSNTANQNISSVAVEDGKITINDAPIAVADQITVAEGGTATTLVGGATNVLSNDTDLENNILTAILVSDVSNGTLTLNSNGTFSYTHNGSETTSDSFTYKANDGNADSNVETVTITVSKSLSTDSFEKTITVRVYPNPTNDIITVTILDELILEKIELYNSLGQFIARYAKNTISIQNLAMGNYFLKIYTSGGNISKKIIKI